jgi:hypothetical protein
LPEFGEILIFLAPAARRGLTREVDVADTRRGWDGEPDRLSPLRFLLLVAFVGGLVVLIWWAYATGHIKHVESVPPPITAPTAATVHD